MKKRIISEADIAWATLSLGSLPAWAQSGNDQPAGDEEAELPFSPG
jgi:hypothetical protein